MRVKGSNLTHKISTAHTHTHGRHAIIACFELGVQANEQRRMHDKARRQMLPDPIRCECEWRMSVFIFTVVKSAAI